MRNLKIHINKMMGAASIVLLMGSCYSNNCPLNNTVTCNYSFYDASGTPISYGDTITVTTLMPGYKTVYTYRKLGNATVTREEQDTTLIALGYTESATQQRNDTILLNRMIGASSLSIPMSYFGDTDTLVFKYGKISLADTIKVEHTSYAHVELPECGTYRFHTLKSVHATDAAIDHIEISNAKVEYEGKENIRIYFNGVVE